MFPLATATGCCYCRARVFNWVKKLPLLKISSNILLLLLFGLHLRGFYVKGIVTAGAAARKTTSEQATETSSGSSSISGSNNNNNSSKLKHQQQGKLQAAVAAASASKHSQITHPYQNQQQTQCRC